MFIKFFIGVFGVIPGLSYAIYIDAVTFDIPAEAEFIAKNIYNDTSSPRMYLINAVKIDRPGLNEKRSRIPDGEILYTPLKFSLQPNQWEYFKIFYRGPKDNKERYYRILFREVPLDFIEEDGGGKHVYLSPIIALETILVVRPRKLKLDYHYDNKQGILKNTGNTYFRVLIIQGCDGKDEEGFSAYVLPGQRLKHPDLIGSNKKFIIALERYIPLGKECFK